ncbi:MAG: chemotaxis response regulator protein-glutamate methylesterase [Planctomycetota bacterium]
MRVVVVDDSAFMRRAVEKMLASDPQIEVVGRGRNGVQAVELARKLEPDAMTLDIEMPEMDGLTALRKIMREAPTHVVMVSSLTTQGSMESLRALRLGAADVVAKDHSTYSTTIEDIRDELVAKVKALAADAKQKRSENAAKPGKPKPTFDVEQRLNATSGSDINLAGKRFDVVCIGSSTGGPPVLEHVLPAIPADFPAPIVVAQHMPELFTRSMATRLGELCKRPVRHAADGDLLDPKAITICPGGKHTQLQRYGTTACRLKVSDEPASEVYKPSASVLFSTAAKVFGAGVLGIVLTGIGDDGKTGSADIKQAGGTVLAQTADTCVVYGMPRAVAEANLADASVSPVGVVNALTSIRRAAAA